jgi:hypothetical protein
VLKLTDNQWWAIWLAVGHHLGGIAIQRRVSTEEIATQPMTLELARMINQVHIRDMNR